MFGAGATAVAARAVSAFAAVLGAASIMPNEREAVQHALQHTFQIASFRGNQASIVQAAMAGVDTIVLMATGSGKSLCYQLPAVVQSGVTIVACPLVALMDDQLHGLRQRGIGCAKYEGSVDDDERKAILSRLSDTIKILYTSPERLEQSSRLRIRLMRLACRGLLQRLVFDEAHCIALWGQTFRCVPHSMQLTVQESRIVHPSKLLGPAFLCNCVVIVDSVFDSAASAGACRPIYRTCGDLRPNLPGVPFMALTATATTATVQDIKDVLCSDKNPKGCLTFTATFLRSNIRLEVRAKLHPPSQS